MSFLGEIRRRNVFRVAVAYTAIAWALIQIADIVYPAFELAPWVMQASLVMAAVGFVVTVVLAWIYELTPEGIKRTEDAPAGQRTPRLAGRKLDFVIIGVLVLGLAFVVVDQYVIEEGISSARRSIAVLPFENRSSEEEDEYFAGGMHDELLTRLAKIGSLKVISRTSVLEYRDSPKNMRQIGEELGVATILEGGVQRAGDDIRINVQLIDAQTDEHIWAEVYDRELTAANIFAIQREMAFSIAGTLQATLLPEEVARLNDVPTNNMRAWNFYLSGNDYYNRPNDRANQPLAVQQYERAVAEDPGFALAWAGLSGAHSSIYLYGVDASESRLELARNAVERALELGPNLPEAHLAYARYHARNRDLGAALEEFAIAEQGLSGTPGIFQQQALIQRRLGDIDGSVANIERALELDPRNTDTLYQQVVNFMGTGRYAEAREYLDRMLEIAPELVLVRWHQVRISILENGDVTQARAAARRVPGAVEFGYSAALYDRDYETALEYLDKWNTEIVSAANSFSPIASYRGVIHRLAGNADLAVEGFTTARAQIESALESNPNDARIVLALGEALVGIGEVEEGLRTANRAMEILPVSRDAVTGAAITVQAVVRVFAPAGDFDAVIQHLDAYLSGPFAFWSIEGLLPDPRLDGVRDDPRFQALVETYRRQ
jgi:TolB-like protein/tetratricopeptide (TPR) repeat protein